MIKSSSNVKIFNKTNKKITKHDSEYEHVSKHIRNYAENSFT